MTNLAAALLALPSSQLDAALRPRIEAWSTPPKPLELLEVVDRAIHDGTASGFVIALLQVLYEARCREEGVTHAELVPLATWRDSHRHRQNGEGQP